MFPILVRKRINKSSQNFRQWCMFTLFKSLISVTSTFEREKNQILALVPSIVRPNMKFREASAYSIWAEFPTIFLMFWGYPDN